MLQERNAPLCDRTGFVSESARRERLEPGLAAVEVAIILGIFGVSTLAKCLGACHGMRIANEIQ